MCNKQELYTQLTETSIRYDNILAFQSDYDSKEEKKLTKLREKELVEEMDAIRGKINLLM